jgi:hypothetical protein
MVTSLTVPFTHDSKYYHLAVKHYKRKRQSFIRADWYEFPPYGMPILRWIDLGWSKKNSKYHFFELRTKRDDDFIQQMGNTIYEVLKVVYRT